MHDETPPQPRKRVGFAAMSPEKRRAIAARGGRNVPKDKRSFSQVPGLAAVSGRKGGSSVSPANRSFSTNRELAREAGRKGGKSTQKAKEGRAAP